MVSEEAQSAFYEGRRSARFPFAINDSVAVIEGRKPGVGAAVISPESDFPEVKYLIEYGDDGSMEILSVGQLRPL